MGFLMGETLKYAWRHPIFQFFYPRVSSWGVGSTRVFPHEDSLWLLMSFPMRETPKTRKWHSHEEFTKGFPHEGTLENNRFQSGKHLESIENIMESIFFSSQLLSPWVSSAGICFLSFSRFSSWGSPFDTAPGVWIPEFSKGFPMSFPMSFPMREIFGILHFEGFLMRSHSESSWGKPLVNFSVSIFFPKGFLMSFLMRRISPRVSSWGDPWENSLLMRKAFGKFPKTSFQGFPREFPHEFVHC